MDIRPVNSKRGWKDFHQVKRDIYQDDPAAVIPLRPMEYAQLDDTKHPFYQHAQRQAFVAYRNNNPIARIVAVKDDLHNEHYSDRVGFFGFFECPDDQELSESLLNTAKAWLLERGLNIMRGPCNPSMKSEFGVLVDGHQYPPFLMMAHTPKYYARLLETAGFAVARRFFAFLLDVEKGEEEAQRRLQKVSKFTDRVKKRFTNLRVEFATPKNIESVLRQVNILGNEVRSEGWGFVPMTEAELDFMVAQVRRIIDPQTVLLLYVGDELAGYHVSVPDLNWAIKKTKGPDWLRYLQLVYWMKRIPQARCIALGAARKHRRSGIGIIAVEEMVKRMRANQFWEFSWVDEQNSLSIASIDRAVPSEKYKTYHLYEKPIEP